MPALLPPTGGLTDSVVTLRRWRHADFTQRYAGFADPDCLRFSFPLDAPFTEAHLRTTIDAEERERRAGVAIGLAVVDAADPGPVLGAASLYDIDLTTGRAAVGYWLAAHARGRGRAIRSVRLLTAWAFGELGIARLELTCGPDNIRSQRVAERCGFTREALLRSHLPFRGARRDTVVFGLLPDDPGTR